MKPSPASAPSYWLTRFFFLRFLGFIYLIAFLVAAQQFLPLLGSRGIFPVPAYLAQARQFYGSGFSLYWHLPTLFWVNASFVFIQALIGVGLVLSVLVLL